MARAPTRKPRLGLASALVKTCAEQISQMAELLERHAAADTPRRTNYEAGAAALRAAAEVLHAYRTGRIVRVVVFDERDLETARDSPDAAGYSPRIRAALDYLQGRGDD